MTKYIALQRAFYLTCFALTIMFILGVIAFDNVEKLKSELSTANSTIEQLRSDNTQMANSVLFLSEEVQLRQNITSLIVDAGRSYNIDPKLLAITIKSESNFRPNPQHALPHVIGSAGINVKANNKLKHNASSYVGNIYASAEILAGYIETSDSLTLALTRYKGLSPQGFGQAKEIVKEYNK